VVTVNATKSWQREKETPINQWWWQQQWQQCNSIKAVAATATMNKIFLKLIKAVALVAAVAAISSLIKVVLQQTAVEIFLASF